MTDTEKQKLLPYFAYAYVSQVYPDEFKENKSPEEIQNLIQSHQDEISKAAADYEDWDALSEQVNSNNAETEEEPNDEIEQVIQSAKNGAKLKKINKLRAVKTAKCGCEMKTVKKGGKVTKVCVPKKVKGKATNDAIEAAKNVSGKKKTMTTGSKDYLADANKKKPIKTKKMK